MPRTLNLADIQGNILRPYGFPKARYIFLNIQDSPEGRVAGREFVQAIRPRITTALPWQSSESHGNKYPHSHLQQKLPQKPQVTFNIAFSCAGLYALGLPTRTLSNMPTEFIDGMAARAEILGDNYGCKPGTLDAWDPIWCNADPAKKVHILIAINARPDPDGPPVDDTLRQATDWVFRLCDESRGRVMPLAGHKPDTEAFFQDSAILLEPGPGGALIVNKEHFGLSDGFGDPAFDGQFTAETEQTEVIGGGKILPDQSWAPLATGEFLLGYPDEAQEVPPAAMPLEFTRNGTFMAYRKLHQNVASFRDYLASAAQSYAKANNISTIQEAKDTVTAKMVGRWPDGVPLMAAPTYQEWIKFNDDVAEAVKKGDATKKAALERSLVDFKFRTDRDGSKCPITAHLRRANTRDALDPTGDSTDPAKWNGSVINNRRRILRRGLPYGNFDPAAPDEGDHGIIFLALCASLFRQFEFVQQQWIQYGLDFNAGNDTCPIAGNHGPDAKFVIPGSAQTKTRPFICHGLPQFVEVRGGEYFFVPSITALRMIGMGTVDPT